MITVVLACAPIGLMDWIASVAVGVIVTDAVGEAGAAVTVAEGTTVVGAAVVVVVTGVGDAGVAVTVGDGVNVTGVNVAGGVIDEINVATGVIKIGAPTSLQPRSGAVPAKTIGLGGTASPLLVTNWATPLST